MTYGVQVMTLFLLCLSLGLTFSLSGLRFREKIREIGETSEQVGETSMLSLLGTNAATSSYICSSSTTTLLRVNIYIDRSSTTPLFTGTMSPN